MEIRDFLFQIQYRSCLKQKIQKKKKKPAEGTLKDLKRKAEKLRRKRKRRRGDGSSDEDREDYGSADSDADQDIREQSFDTEDSEVLLFGVWRGVSFFLFF